jgi:hypothetical protein
MTEQEGRAVLRRRFEAAGVAIATDHRMNVADREIVLDGYDAARKIGYEYVTTQAGDRQELTPAVVAELERRMRAGELALLLIDEVEAIDEAVLEEIADRFLAAVRQRGML